ncbi:MAG: FAD-dependent oxidoreductase [Chloroflexota bacterium]|nr:FAD-dependent oxidoreductase [Chloroflexota bacterium]
MAESRGEAALVVGAGIAGIRCALDLAEAGTTVYLADRAPTMGGTLVQLDKWFPDDHCSMCKVLPIFSRDDCSQHCLRRGIYHPNIEFLPQAQVQSVAGEAGAFQVALEVRPPGVTEERCIGCDRCVEACPVTVPSEFDEGMTPRKAIYRRHPLAAPTSYVIDWEACTRCGDCVAACPTAAIDLEAGEGQRTVDVAAIVLATGFDEFDPRALGQYGYGRYPNVVTSIELERILSPSGPSTGRLLRPSDGEPPRSIAFLQCVGSRDREHGYCSSACCMYALKEAQLIKERDPDIEAEIFFMDLRAFGKGYHRYYQRAQEEHGIQFSRCRVPQVKQDPQTRGLLLVARGEDGRPRQRRFDMVVLSVGQRPSRRFTELAATVGVELNEWGFVKTEAFAPTTTSREGIYACGSATSPKDIADTVVEADAAACAASQHLARPGLLTDGARPAEDSGDQAPRTAVFLCHCGEELAEALDIAALAEFARGLGGVVSVHEVPYLCLDDGLAEIGARAADSEANRVLVAACAAPAFQRRLRGAAQEAGIDPALIDIIDLREQVAWSHQGQREAATDMARAQLAMAAARLRGQRPLPLAAQVVSPRALVIGGGLAGMSAALCLAGHGLETHLVERSDRLGGHLRHIHGTLDGDDPQALLADLVRRVEESDLVKVYVESEVASSSGCAGDFDITLKDREGATTDLNVGAIVVASGGEGLRPTEYGYGESAAIITQEELETRLASGELDPQALRQVVMVQCVGSRDAERPYCSRVCCTQALKNALALKAQNPALDIVVLYRDVMSYGFKEGHYTRAREGGVIFISYDVERKPAVSTGGERPVVEVVEPALGAKLRLEPDLVVLSPAIIPGDNEALAAMLGLPLTEEGFFQEADPKFRPVDFLHDGIYVCGLAHSPRDISETIAQAQAAAERAAILLGRGQLTSGRVVSEVNARRCSGCEVCITVCPFGARFKDPVTRVVVVREALCQGCGACVAACPSGAAKLKGLTDSQLFSMVDAAL